MTIPEKKLWESIRRDRLGVRFRRQYGIGRYIADFYCPELKLVIEIDGSGHFTGESKVYDEERTGFMNSIGIRVLRYSNNEVMNNLTGVLNDLSLVIEEKIQGFP